jgi:alpha-N-acetylglucosamine transferase
MGELRTLWQNMKKHGEEHAKKGGSEAGTKKLLSQFKDDLGPTLDKIEKAVQDKKADDAIHKLIDKAVTTIDKYLDLVKAANQKAELPHSYADFKWALDHIKEKLTKMKGA